MTRLELIEELKTMRKALRLLDDQIADVLDEVAEDIDEVEE